MKLIEQRPGLVWLPITVLNFFIWYLSTSLTGSVIKTIVDDCDKTYKIDKYFKTDWFCPIKEEVVPFNIQMDNKKKK